MDYDSGKIKSGGKSGGGYLRRLIGDAPAPEGVLSDSAITVPNMISMGRLLATPLIIALISLDWHASALWIFILAALSDALDGFLARYAAPPPSRIGTYLDPSADKILVVSLFITLGAIGDIPVWLVILVASRDILIVGGILFTWVLYERIWVAPLIIGKLTTCVQLASVALILAERAYGMFLPDLITESVLAATAIMTLLSGSLYTLQWFIRVGQHNGETKRKSLEESDSAP